MRALADAYLFITLIQLCRMYLSLGTEEHSNSSFVNHSEEIKSDYTEGNATHLLLYIYIYSVTASVHGWQGKGSKALTEKTKHPLRFPPMALTYLH